MWSRDVFEALVGLAERAQGLVEHTPVGFCGVTEFRPEETPGGAFRDEETVVVIGVFAVCLLRHLQRHPLADPAVHDPLMFSLEDTGAALQEQQS